MSIAKQWLHCRASRVVWSRTTLILPLFFILTIFLQCTDESTDLNTRASSSPVQQSNLRKLSQNLEASPTARKWVRKAIFAGGCFWCMEPPFEKKRGVLRAISGYIGGKRANPSYRQVAAGITGYTEAVLVEYDSRVIDYNTLLNIFWMNINPTQANGQFYDLGSQYRTGIFYVNGDQKKLAEHSKKRLTASGRFKKPIATEITKAGRFWPAETYHQDYYKKNPRHYYRYRKGSGRDDYIKRVWGKKATTTSSGKSAEIH